MLTTIAENVTLQFSFTSLTGDVQYDPETHLLNLLTDEGEEAMSTSFQMYGFEPREGRTFIKGWSEHTNLAKSLEEAGIVEIARALNVGPGRQRAYEVRVLAADWTSAPIAA